MPYTTQARAHSASSVKNILSHFNNGLFITLLLLVTYRSDRLLKILFYWMNQVVVKQNIKLLRFWRKFSSFWRENPSSKIFNLVWQEINCIHQIIHFLKFVSVKLSHKAKPDLDLNLNSKFCLQRMGLRSSDTVIMEASFWGFFRTDFTGHFRKLFLFTKFIFSNLLRKVSF